MMIEISELQVRHVYKLHARNLRIGAWDGRTFIGIREKFSARFLDDCEVAGHTAFALEDTGLVVPDEIPMKVYLGSKDQGSGREVAFDKPVKDGGKGWYYVDTGEPDEAIRSFAVSNRALFGFMDEAEKNVVDSDNIDGYDEGLPE